MKVKELVEKLLNHLDPAAEVEAVMSFAEDITDEKEIQLFDADYRDGKFVIKVVEWL